MWRNITFSNFSESSWQERLSYQYPQRFVKFDPEHLKYLLPGNIPCQQFASPSGSNAPKFTIKVVSGKFFSTLKICFQYWYVRKNCCFHTIEFSLYFPTTRYMQRRKTNCGGHSHNCGDAAAECLWHFRGWWLQPKRFLFSNPVKTAYQRVHFFGLVKTLMSVSRKTGVR